MWVLRDITPRGIWPIGRVEAVSLDEMDRPDVFREDSLRNLRAPRRLFPAFSLHEASFVTSQISNFFPVRPFLPAAWGAGACQ